MSPDATTEATLPEAVRLPAHVLLSHPKNPRPELSEDDPKVMRLVENLRTRGQKQPCLVRPRGEREGVAFYEVIIGNRRRFAQELLGKPVLCFVEDLSDDEAESILLTDNDTHDQPDPILEAEVVQGLLERPGYTIERVAEALSRPVPWVARRANLRNLSAKIRSALRESGDVDPALVQVRRWPIRWLEELALLEKSEQDQFLGVGAQPWQRPRFEDFPDLHRAVRERLGKLSKAPWGLEDETLVPAAGSCLACPKTSARSPGLFEEIADPNPASALCRDTTCWRKKEVAHRERLVTIACSKHPDAVLVQLGHTARAEEWSGHTVYGRNDFTKCKKSDAKAIRAVDVGGSKPRAIWISPTSWGDLKRPEPASKSARAKSKNGASKGQANEREQLVAKLEASKAKVARRRRALQLQLVDDALGQLTEPPVREVLLRLLPAFAIARPMPTTYRWTWASRKSSANKLAKDEAAWRENLWTRMRPEIQQAIRYELSSGGDLATVVRGAKWLVAELALVPPAPEGDAPQPTAKPGSWKPFTVRAKAEIPDPKFWTRHKQRLAELEAETPPPAVAKGA